MSERALEIAKADRQHGQTVADLILLRVAQQHLPIDLNRAVALPGRFSQLFQEKAVAGAGLRVAWDVLKVFPEKASGPGQIPLLLGPVHLSQNRSGVVPQLKSMDEKPAGAQEGERSQHVTEKSQIQFFTHEQRSSR